MISPNSENVLVTEQIFIFKDATISQCNEVDIKLRRDIEKTNS